MLEGTGKGPTFPNLIGVLTRIFLEQDELSEAAQEAKQGRKKRGERYSMPPKFGLSLSNRAIQFPNPVDWLEFADLLKALCLLVVTE